MNQKLAENIAEFHWALQVMDTMDAGLVVLDLEHRVCAWNTFMQAYSGIASVDVMGRNLFDVVPNLPTRWLKRKLEASLRLKTRTFSCWEDRPYIFKFNNFSPVSAGMATMFQNVTITPLKSLNGEYNYLCVIINDVSDIAKSKLSLRASNEKLSHLSRTDRLTALFNRGYWEQQLQEEFICTRQRGGTASLVMFDIDHFKKVNDQHGHLAGDQVLREMSQLLLQTKRQSDIAGRYGGEEFGVILPNTSAEMALYFTERIRQRVADNAVNTEHAKIACTISLGVCEWSESLGDHSQWIALADQALYHAKNTGRNRTCVYNHTLQQPQAAL